MYDSGDDFYKSYIRLEYVSMYNKEVRHKNFTIFFDSPQEQQQDNNKIYIYKHINSVEGLI